MSSPDYVNDGTYAVVHDLLAEAEFLWRYFSTFTDFDCRPEDALRRDPENLTAAAIVAAREWVRERNHDMAREASTE